MKKYIFILIAVLISQSAFSFTPPTRLRGTTFLNVKDFGAYGDKNHDDTAAIQSAIDALPSDGGTVFIPAGKYLVDGSKPLLPKSKMLLKLDPNAYLYVIPNNLIRYYAIHIVDVDNVEVQGGHIVGERQAHTVLDPEKPGEWGYGIATKGASHVTIRDTIISSMWGDGLGVWPSSGVPSNDVVIYHVISTNNRRQGLSIGGSRNVTVYGSVFSYTNGTAPQYGIDIEPDGVTEAHNVRIEACKLHHNKGGGIQTYKNGYNFIFSKNEISYNAYGIYTIGTTTATIWNNKISHNKYNGVAVRKGSADVKVFANQFRNNYTSKFGVTNDTNQLVSIVGRPPETYNDLNVDETTTSAIDIIRNWYAE